MVSSRDASEHASKKVQEKGTATLFNATAPFLCVPGMVQVLRVKVPSRVFTAKCSEPQAENSNV